MMVIVSFIERVKIHWFDRFYQWIALRQYRVYVFSGKNDKLCSWIIFEEQLVFIAPALLLL